MKFRDGGRWVLNTFFRWGEVLLTQGLVRAFKMLKEFELITLR